MTENMYLGYFRSEVRRRQILKDVNKKLELSPQEEIKFDSVETHQSLSPIGWDNSAIVTLRSNSLVHPNELYRTSFNITEFPGNCGILVMFGLNLLNSISLEVEEDEDGYDKVVHVYSSGKENINIHRMGKMFSIVENIASRMRYCMVMFSITGKNFTDRGRDFLAESGYEMISNEVNLHSGNEILVFCKKIAPMEW